MQKTPCLPRLVSLFLPLCAFAFALAACNDQLAPEPDQTTGDATRGAGASLAYEAISIGTLGGESGGAGGINSRNWVVGSAQNDEGQLRAFLWRDGHMEELEGLGGSFSTARAINDGGLIVGSAETAGGDVRAVLWRGGQPQELGTLGGSFSRAVAVNQRGQVVGMSTRADGEMRPFLWWRGEMQELPVPPADQLFRLGVHGINDRGQAVGVWSSETTDFFEKALIWTRGEVSTLPGPCNEYAAFDINSRGMIVGAGLGCPLSPTEIGPIFWPRPTAESENLIPLAGPGDRETFLFFIGSAFGLNDRGQVVGWSEAAEASLGRDLRPTVWDRGEPIDLSGEPDLDAGAGAINNRSVAVGRLGGLPTVWFPAGSSLPGVSGPPGPRPAVTARDAGPSAVPPVSPGMGLRESLPGSMADAEWAAKLCETTPRLRPARTELEILAGCP